MRLDKAVKEFQALKAKKENPCRHLDIDSSAIILIRDGTNSNKK